MVQYVLIIHSMVIELSVVFVECISTCSIDLYVLHVSAH